MANPPKAKGTAGETELLHELAPYMPGLVRTPPATLWDLEQKGALPSVTELLATRPDRGQWLVTMTLDEFKALWLVVTDAVDQSRLPEVRIEVKRYARFALHSIFEKKFGRKR
jgi:hypothetical protein